MILLQGRLRGALFGTADTKGNEGTHQALHDFVFTQRRNVSEQNNEVNFGA